MKKIKKKVKKKKKERKKDKKKSTKILNKIDIRNKDINDENKEKELLKEIFIKKNNKLLYNINKLNIISKDKEGVDKKAKPSKIKKLEIRNLMKKI